MIRNDSCQKNRQFIYSLSLMIMVLVSLFFTSCGTKVNSAENYKVSTKNISFLMAESNCLHQPSKRSPEYLKAMKLINEWTQKLSNQPLQVISESNYDFSHPMVVSSEIIQNLMGNLEVKNQLNLLTWSDLNQLQEYVLRFEGMRCQFSGIEDRKRLDIRSYLKLIHNNDTSDKNLIEMCRLTENEGYCAKELESLKREKKLDRYIDFYREKVQNEIFAPMFILKKQHQLFECENVNQKIEMTIDVINTGWAPQIFKFLLDSIAKTWSKNGLEIKFNEVTQSNENTLIIEPISSGISFVNSDQPRVIHLVSNLDILNLGKVVAHEFGHVLGFPDCYIEFFNQQTKELVYYELYAKNDNIMCSLKFGAKVQNSYIDQLKEKSCKFR